MLMRYKSLWRALRAFPPGSSYSNTTAVGVNAATPAASPADNVPKASEISSRKSSESQQNSQKLVSAVFSSLKDTDDREDVVNDELSSKISSAETIDSLLSLYEKEGFQRNHALKIVSKLADWTSKKKILLTEFEGDSRFIKLCNLLGHQVSMKSSHLKKGVVPEPAAFSDLGVVLGVAGDDEAAKLVNTITVPQMIKVLSSLSYKKRRSIPLLRSLAFNIGKSSDELNIKDCADILYACAQLCFHDEVLFEKVCSDLCSSIKNNNKPAVVGSIITSLGMLKYKDKELMDIIGEWVIEHFSVCRVQDLTSLILTLAAINHIPANEDSLFKKLETHLQQADVATPLLWLDIVWALAILNKASVSHLSSVLNKDFVSRLESLQQDGLSIISKLKLLNINGAAKLLVDNYPGPFLEPDSEISVAEVPRAKDKQALVVTVLDTLSNLLPSSVYMNSNINTGMGYIIDGTCVMDSNLTPLPLIDKKTGEPIDRSQPGVRKGTKVAILVLDYHDITKGATDPVGIASLAIRLTQKSGYKVITVPYHDFNPRDKLVMRVQYLEQQLKNVIKNNSNNVAAPNSVSYRPLLS